MNKQQQHLHLTRSTNYNNWIETLARQSKRQKKQYLYMPACGGQRNYTRGREDEGLLRKLEEEIGVSVDVYQRNKKRTLGGQLRKAEKHRQNGRNNSYTLHQKFLERQVEELATENETKKTKAVYSIQTTESRKVMHKVIKQYLKLESRAGLTQVDVPEWDK
eukprot:3847792-Ditylum_brightwellii.AAC.1